MVFKQYSSFLPSYLGGNNIRRHSSLIEQSDRYLDGLVELFRLWDKLERPILIKREQQSTGGRNSVTLYVNTHSPITEIIIEGDIEETITPEDTVTTSYERTWTIQNPSIEIYSGSSVSLRMPSVTVTVRTETHTYKKAYPENDTIQNNDADHDIFLDIVGGLLGIPRRQYSTVNIPFNLIRNFSATVPPYMAKEVQTGDTITILPCTEDDYYYYERLNRFIHSQEDHLRMFHTIYDPQAVILKKEDNIIPSELVGTDTTVLFTHIQKGAIMIPNSLNIDTTNIQQLAEQTLPITRPVHIYPYAKIIQYPATTQEQYVNKYKLHLTLGLNVKTIDQPRLSHEVPIANLPVNITYEDGTEVGTFITDETGTAHISIDGARSGQQKIYWDLTREYPYFQVISEGVRNSSYNASLFKLSLDDDAWQYKIANGTGLILSIENNNAIAVKVFSPPDRSEICCNFFPGGNALISTPVFNISDGSVKDKEASPPLNNSLNVLENDSCTKANVSLNFSFITSSICLIISKSISSAFNKSSLCEFKNVYLLFTSSYSSIDDTLTSPSDLISLFNLLTFFLASSSSISKMY